MSQETRLNPLLQYSQYGTDRCLINWDLREQPSTSAHPVNDPDQVLSDTEFAQYATHPSLPTLHVSCGIFPEDWLITVENPLGVTVLDVLQTIHQVVMAQIKQPEYDQLSPKQQNRVAQVFDRRWRASPTPQTTWGFGVLRVDCLLKHTIFAGLSMSIGGANACILTLRRIPEN